MPNVTANDVKIDPKSDKHGPCERLGRVLEARRFQDLKKCGVLIFFSFCAPLGRLWAPFRVQLVPYVGLERGGARLGTVGGVETN